MEEPKPQKTPFVRVGGRITEAPEPKTFFSSTTLAVTIVVILIVIYAAGAYLHWW